MPRCVAFAFQFFRGKERARRRLFILVRDKLSVFSSVCVSADRSWKLGRCGAGYSDSLYAREELVLRPKVVIPSCTCRNEKDDNKLFFIYSINCARIFKQSMGAINRVGIGLTYWPTRLHSLAELIPWNRFLGSLKV
jgi:hypothetical protein